MELFIRHRRYDGLIHSTRSFSIQVFCEINPILLL
jgi:hypothetical protein